MNCYRTPRVVGVLLCLAAVTISALSAQQPLEKAWYTPAELLTALAQRDGVRWALPQTLSGRALVGEQPTDVLLDAACRQWGLRWTRSGDVLVVHRADEARLKELAEALRQGDRAAAWELGWLRDGRALPLLTTALAGPDEGLALAAAQAIETLDTLVPLGQDERVDALPAGRVSLAVPFPPTVDLAPLLASPYPPVRAAALRVLLGQGGPPAEAADERTRGDRSDAVRRVRRQMRGTLPAAPPVVAPPRPNDAIQPVPPTAAEIQAACARMVEEIADLAKKAEWEQMRWRVRTLSAWSRADHPEATATLIELSATKIQYGWFPAFVQMHLASNGSPEVAARLKEVFAEGDRGTIARGLELSYSGEALLKFTWPHLDDQTVAYITTRKAGREAHDDFVTWAKRGNVPAVDALGVIGGPSAAAAIAAVLNTDGPRAGTAIFRSAKALGRLGSLEALETLLSASESTDRVRRHAAALSLGQIGGRRAETRLRELLARDSDRLIRAAAADGLEQIGGAENQTLVAAFREQDAGLPAMVYRPRNARFGPDFPVGKWVNLEIAIPSDSAFGEIGWNYDLANRLFMRYGGCSGYHNELTLFDLGTEQFVQRRPNEKYAGWGDRRLMNGCTAGRSWDPLNKVIWLGPALGSTEPNLAVYDYYNKFGTFRFGSYDLATDRFQAVQQANYATRYALDWSRGLLYPIKFTHPLHITKDFSAFDVKSQTWLDKPTDGDYPRDQHHGTAAVDQASGLLVVYIAPQPDHPAETWTFDPREDLWKNMRPAVQPAGVPGAGFAYDTFHKLLLLQSGKETLQYGSDSITWTYDVRTNTWTDLNLADGPGNPWVGALDFDPEHNVFVLFHFPKKQVWALRVQPAAVGTAAE